MRLIDADKLPEQVRKLRITDYYTDYMRGRTEENNKIQKIIVDKSLWNKTVNELPKEFVDVLFVTKDEVISGYFAEGKWISHRWVEVFDPEEVIMWTPYPEIG